MQAEARAVSWSRAPVWCFCVFLDPNLPSAKLPWAAPVPPALLWSFHAATRPGHPAKAGLEPQSHNSLLQAPERDLCHGIASTKHPWGWGFPAVTALPLPASNPGMGTQAGSCGGAGVSPDLCAVSSFLHASPRFRKRTGISDCKVCWTPP